MISTVENALQKEVKDVKARISIFDESLLTKTQSAKKLLCTVSREFISLSLVDTKEMKFYAFEAYYLPGNLADNKLSQIILSLPEKSDILKKINFRDVSVQVVNNKYTFVPEILFRQPDTEQYYSLNHGDATGLEILSDTIRAYETMNVFSVSKSILSGLKKIFENFSCHHHISGQLESVSMESRKREGKTLFVNFHPSLTDIILTEGKKLILCNSFNYKSIEDALYYLLNISEQLGLNTDKTPIVVSGEVQKNSELYNLLSKYLRNISFSERIKAATFTYGFDDLPSHSFYSDFSQVLAVNSN